MSLHGYLRASPTISGGDDAEARAKVSVPMLVGWGVVLGVAGAMFVGVLRMKRGR